MKIFIINKKHFGILIAITIFTICISFYSIYASTSKPSFCYEDSTFCVSLLSYFKENASDDIQERIDEIYSSKEKIAYLTFDDGPTKVATPKVLDILKELNYAYVDWNALNQDSVHKYTSSQLLSNLKKSCKNKDSIIILMHDTADVSRSYLALQDSIKYLKEQGYTFKTFEDLLSKKITNF